MKNPKAIVLVFNLFLQPVVGVRQKTRLYRTLIIITTCCGITKKNRQNLKQMTMKANTVITTMNRSTLKYLAATPPLKNRNGKSHYFAPTRAKVGDAIQFCEKMGIQYFKDDAFQRSGVSSRQRMEVVAG